jgi:hypothetical protein
MFFSCGPEARAPGRGRQSMRTDILLKCSGARPSWPLLFLKKPQNREKQPVESFIRASKTFINGIYPFIIGKLASSADFLPSSTAADTHIFSSETEIREK